MSVMLLNITMDFPGTRALDNVSVTFEHNKVYGLIGENGAGKTTLVNILGGMQMPSQGQICIEGENVVLHGSYDAMKKGIAHVSQEGSLVQNFSGAENIMLGDEPRNVTGIVHKNLLNNKAQELMARWFPNLDIDLKKMVSTLPMAEQKVIEIVRALRGDISLIILDEPTATLEMAEKKQLWKIIQELPKRNVGVILISHFLSEIIEMSDAIIVLRDGHLVGNFEKGDRDEKQLSDLMLKQESNQSSQILQKPQLDILQKPVLSIKDWSNDHFMVDEFNIHPGEIVGLIGLTGAGHFNFAESIYDHRHIQKGQLFLDGKDGKATSIAQIKESGIAYIPDRRMLNSLAYGASVHESLTLIHPHFAAKAGVFMRNKEKAETLRVIDFLKIKTPHRHQAIKNLSGGNKQKVSIGKWLYGADENYKVMIFVEPCEGVDIGAKQEIYKQIMRLANQGVAIIIASSDLGEIEILCHRTIAFVHGRQSMELKAEDFSQEKFIESISGG